MNWSYFDKPEFKAVNDMYLPMMGEGDNMATQIVTVVNKLVYKWYNDGDVFDNTRYMEGWWNDLSSYANWMHKYVPDSIPILEGVWDCRTNDEYEDLLVELADRFLDNKYLESVASTPKVGTIYECDGPFEYIEPHDDDNDDDYWEDDEDDEYEDDEDDDF